MGNYYDLDDIIADNQKLPCKFNVTVPGLGYLEGNIGQPLDANTKLNLPLWLSSVLAICEVSQDSQTTFLDLIHPEFFNNKVINAIRANAVNIDLHSILPNYYKLCEKWCVMFSDVELIEVVSQMLKERSNEINDYGQNPKQISSMAGNKFLYSLDEFEKRLYKISTESHKLSKEWFHNQD
ncbi:hypothetical protein BABINDRAFT_40402 [Babjeviella inositovora NRRL Y-12698]|uniref:DNA replication complex GINS protein PSF3 n=1 Tax=Babjeviella inositovora NRRL Y-12698 TaxID=984486 RepID=A0A1E3QK22_9ASCO|nr:uncharacterized protein BABINDRAFT_40402 [Babjeviella inositovora NRRL Y-12698]ODQ78046.1 hypothetical protein BABINDRAFT_40402 [Babjeviella inositovora NRRL Y-12698]